MLSKEENKRRRAVLYRRDMESRSEVRKGKENRSRSGERKKKSGNEIRTKKGDLESRSRVRKEKETWRAGVE